MTVKHAWDLYALFLSLQLVILFGRLRKALEKRV